MCAVKGFTLLAVKRCPLILDKNSIKTFVVVIVAVV